LRYKSAVKRGKPIREENVVGVGTYAYRQDRIAAAVEIAVLLLGCEDHGGA